MPDPQEIRVHEPVLSGPVAVTATSWPYRSALVPGGSPDIDLTAAGWVEEEWFADGVADAWDPDGRLLSAAAPYRTRVLVRRPADPARCSGTVVLEPFHVLGESTPVWRAVGRHLVREGHAWVGVTVHSGSFERYSRQPGGITRLRAVAPDRYASLAMPEFHDPPSTKADRGPAGFDPAEMDWKLAIATAQGHDIGAGIAQLLKTRTAAVLLGGAMPAARVYGTGFSQTGRFWATFLDRGFHDAARHDRAAPGRPALDAYLVCVAPAPSARPTDAVLVNVLSEGELVGTLIPGTMHAPDDRDGTDGADGPGVRVRGYEVPGPAHTWQCDDGEPQPADGHALHDDRQWNLLLHAVVANLDEWVRGGRPMPRAPRTERDATAKDGLARDAAGNVRGGLRSPWVDVPSASYRPRCRCSPTRGTMRPLDPSVLAALYGGDDPAGVRAERWAAAVDDAVADRRLTPEDGRILRETPE